MSVDWSERVQAAAVTGDGSALAELYEEALVEKGPVEANRAWQIALSGFDAEAATG